MNNMPARRSRRLIAFEVAPPDDMPLEPAPVNRDWMDQSGNRFAYRCLPLVIANQSGWIIRCPVDFSARWNGGSGISDLKVRLPRDARSGRILSHFGEGVLTLTLPYLFQTPRGINLWVKGPTNWIKDGVQPLEAVVETDWNETTFTMNWKMTRRNHTIRFEQGEPICMIVPIPRGLAESLEPVQKPLSTSPKLARAYQRWSESRSVFNEGLARNDGTAVKRGWQRDYMLGMNVDGKAFTEHQTKLSLHPFRQITN
jgi:hypothetical protein